MTIREFLHGSFTDVNDRPEPKMILGCLFILVDLIYACISIFVRSLWSKEIFWALGSFGLGLVGVTTVTDAINDAKSGG